MGGVPENLIDPWSLSKWGGGGGGGGRLIKFLERRGLL